MKTIKLIEGPDAKGVNYSYGHTTIGWAFFTKPDAKGVAKIVNRVGYCRESLTLAMFKSISPSLQEGRAYKGIDKKRLRLVARIISNSNNSSDHNKRVVETFFRGVEAGVNLLNILEDRHKWAQTKLYDTEHNIHPNLVTKALVGSNKWMISAHMLSLFCLIVRVATRSKYFSVDKMTDFDSMDKAMKSYKRPVNPHGGDQGYIGAVWPYVDALMKSHKQIFKGTTITQNWTAKKGDYFYNEGIYKIIGNPSSSINKDIGHRIVDLKKKVAAERKKK